MQLAPGVGSAPSAATCTRATSRRSSAPSATPAAKTSRKRRRKGASTSPSGRVPRTTSRRSTPASSPWRRPARARPRPCGRRSASRTGGPILFRGAQLARLPLNEDDEVSTQTVIGRTAEKPLELAAPFYVSHMSFGALSREAKIALREGRASSDTAMCSGRGRPAPGGAASTRALHLRAGHRALLPRDEAIRQADAVEIKIGQAAKPGLGGHLPAEKVTAEIARSAASPRARPPSRPGRHTGLETPEDLGAGRRAPRADRAAGPSASRSRRATSRRTWRVVLAAEPGLRDHRLPRRRHRGGAHLREGQRLPAADLRDPPGAAVPGPGGQRDHALRHRRIPRQHGHRQGAGAGRRRRGAGDGVAHRDRLPAVPHLPHRALSGRHHDAGRGTARAVLDIERSVERFVNFYRGHEAGTARSSPASTAARNVHDLDLTDLVTLDSEVARTRTSNTPEPHAWESIQAEGGRLPSRKPAPVDHPVHQSGAAGACSSAYPAGKSQYAGDPRF